MPELIIEAGRTEGQYWRDLWRYRELFYVLAWRDITVRYKQTVIGVLWALIQPLINTILLTLIFQYFAHLKSVGNTPYPIMVFAAQMPWQFFTTSLTGASQSVVGSAGLISKIYFPRLIVPAGAVVTALADLFCSFILLIGFMAWYQYPPSWNLLALPLLIALAFAAALGPGLPQMRDVDSRIMLVRRDVEAPGCPDPEPRQLRKQRRQTPPCRAHCECDRVRRAGLPGPAASHRRLSFMNEP